MIYTAIKEQFDYLLKLTADLGPGLYVRPSPMLGNSTIGQHLRHIIEMMQCLLIGYEEGVVNYDDRKRDYRIETDTAFTTALLMEILPMLQRPDKGLTLVRRPAGENVFTTFKRELVYNAEHAIHHMALIKVALREMNINLTDEKFGVAPATIQYRETSTCVQ